MPFEFLTRKYYASSVDSWLHDIGSQVFGRYNKVCHSEGPHDEVTVDEDSGQQTELELNRTHKCLLGAGDHLLEHTNRGGKHGSTCKPQTVCASVCIKVDWHLLVHLPGDRVPLLLCSISLHVLRQPPEAASFRA